MTSKEFTAKATEKFNQCSTSDLIQTAKKLNNDLSDVASYMLDAVLEILMDRMNDSEFVAFCDSL